MMKVRSHGSFHVILPVSSTLSLRGQRAPLLVWQGGCVRWPLPSPTAPHALQRLHSATPSLPAGSSAARSAGTHPLQPTRTTHKTIKPALAPRKPFQLGCNCQPHRDKVIVKPCWQAVAGVSTESGYYVPAPAHRGSLQGLVY